MDNKLNKIDNWQKRIKPENRRKEKKAYIQQAFKNNLDIDIIPIKTINPDGETLPLRVAAYCRVSTYEEEQAGSFELQVQHYIEMINNNPEWTLVDIYADEGVSATSIKKRHNFLRMINDCFEGKIDLIITKNISRFARNSLDCLNIVRQLKTLDPPIGIYFENEDFNSLDNNSEYLLWILSIQAQEESLRKSESIKWAIIERFKKGIPIIPTHNFLGYDKDMYGKIFIVEEEAKIIRYIYDKFIDGTSPKNIAQSLNDNGIPTITGKYCWSSSSIRNILKQEKYCGDVLMQKTYTVDCFSHIVRKNTGQKPQYFIKNAIPAIIPKENWLLVQQLLKSPETKITVNRVRNNLLKGFIYIDIKWSKEEIEKIINERI